MSDIFRKGKRHFRKTLRGRSDDQEPGPSQSPPFVPQGAEGNLPPVATSAMTPERGRANVKTQEESGSTSGSSDLSNSRERLQKWIQQQSSSFLEKWSEPASSHPALGVVKKLNQSSQDLNPESHTCIAALKVRNLFKVVRLFTYTRRAICVLYNLHMKTKRLSAALCFL